MTTPTPADLASFESTAVLQRRWLQSYLQTQAKYDAQIRSILNAGASDAKDAITALDGSAVWSTGVRIAQLKLVMNEVKHITSDTFKKMVPIIQRGQRDQAVTATDALSVTDLRFLHEAFSDAGQIESYLASQRQTAMLGVAHAVSRITQSQRPLSARVYKTQALSNGWVNNVVNAGILKGNSARQIASDVRSSIRPDVPGGVSYAALRLGRTELNNAFHATAITLAQDRPWITGMRWYLSDVHTDHHGEEICERLAGQIFDVDNVPAKPHPQCRCYVAPQVESIDVFARHLTAGQYRDWMNRNAQQAA